MHNRFVQIAGTGKKDFLAFLAAFFLVAMMFVSGGLFFALVVGEAEVKYTESIARRMPYYIFFALIMLQFVLGTVALVLSTVVFLKRPFLSVLSYAARFRWNNFLFGALVSMILLAGSDLVSYVLNTADFHWQFNPAAFFPFLLAALLFFPIQTLFEEAFIRGMVMQHTGYWSRRSWVGLLVSGLFFGALHMQNNEVSEFGTGTMFFVYTSTGIIFGIITLLSEGLEISWGIHLVNNFYVALIHTFPGSSLESPALFSSSPPDPSRILAETLIMSCLMLLPVLIRYRKAPWAKLLA